MLCYSLFYCNFNSKRNIIKNTNKTNRLSSGQKTRFISEKTHQDNVAVKPDLHQRNKHRGRYDFNQLIAVSPLLAQFVKLNDHDDVSIDFANPQAVKALNQALLKQFYGISAWDIPENYLCPPIPGRADYLHYIADLLATANGGVAPKSGAVRVLDIGVGANIIYPIIGHREYGWHFIGTDIDALAIANAQQILDVNNLEAIELRLQGLSSAIFKGVVLQNETFDITICNPPFHKSLAEASAGTQRKWHNLRKSSGKSFGASQSINKASTLNFGGQSTELYCAGGEEAFIGQMVSESKQFSTQCLWFTSLVSKASSLPSVYRTLKKVNALQVKTINMAQGQKKSRIIAWTFLSATQQRQWLSSK